MWTGRTPCQFEGLSGACEGPLCPGSKALSLRSSAQQSGFHLHDSGKLQPLGTHSLLSWTQQPLLRPGELCGMFHTDIQSVFSLAFDYSLLSPIILSGFYSSCPLGQPILQPKCSPRFSSEFFFSPFLLTLIHFYHFSHHSWRAQKISGKSYRG